MIKDSKISIVGVIKKKTSDKEFKAKIQYFRKHPSSAKQDIHNYFLENDDVFYYHVNSHSTKLDIAFLEFYSNNVPRFYKLFNMWVGHINTVYAHENRWCVIF